MPTRSATGSRPIPPPSRISRLDLLAPSFGAADGYGNSAEQIALALERAGVRIQLAGMVRQTGMLTAHSIWERKFEPEGAAIIFYSQPTSWMRQFGGRRAIGMSMYETDTLPQAWATGLRAVDEIFVPSRWQVPIFAAASGGKRTTVIPLGVDGDRFRYRRRTRGNRLRFLHLASTSGDPRKGADLAQRAFAAAFPAHRDDVELVMRSQYAHALERRDPRVMMTFGLATPEALLAEMHAADCLLYPSRGEGFGLIPLEAIASGMPAIFADATGPADYAELGLTVPAALVRAEKPYVGQWWEPSFDALVERLREVDRDYESVTDDTVRHAATVRQKWTWNRSAATILTALS